mgnify:FL=1
MNNGKRGGENKTSKRIESYGDETEKFNRDADKTTFGWPTAPDAEEDPAFVSIVDG